MHGLQSIVTGTSGKGLSEAGRQGPLTLPAVCVSPPASRFPEFSCFACLPHFPNLVQTPSPDAHPRSGCQVGSMLLPVLVPGTGCLDGFAETVLRPPFVLQDGDCDRLLTTAMGVPLTHNL